MNIILPLIIGIIIMIVIFAVFNNYPNPLYYETYNNSSHRNKNNSVRGRNSTNNFY